MDWFEQAVAPNRLIGTRTTTATPPAALTRPLCPYPQVAGYRGTGDPSDAASFACVLPALNVKTSELITQCHQRHRSTEFRQFLDAVDAAVPRHLDVHLIMDNDGTHKTPLIRNWFAKRPRFHVHFTPTYESWLNLVERWFAALTNNNCGAASIAASRS